MIDVIISPDLQLEEKRTEAKARRLKAAERFAVHDRVKAGKDGKPGYLRRISEEGFAAIQWYTGGTISGVEADNLYFADSPDDHREFHWCEIRKAIKAMWAPEIHPLGRSYWRDYVRAEIGRIRALPRTAKSLAFGSKWKCERLGESQRYAYHKNDTGVAVWCEERQRWAMRIARVDLNLKHWVVLPFEALANGEHIHKQEDWIEV